MKEAPYILVVEGAGYIGAYVNKMIAGEGYKTTVLDNLAYRHRDFVQWGKFIQGHSSRNHCHSLEVAPPMPSSIFKIKTL